MQYLSMYVQWIYVMYTCICLSDRLCATHCFKYGVIIHFLSSNFKYFHILSTTANLVLYGYRVQCRSEMCAPVELAPELSKLKETNNLLEPY